MVKLLDSEFAEADNEGDGGMARWLKEVKKRKERSFGTKNSADEDIKNDKAMNGDKKPGSHKFVEGWLLTVTLAQNDVHEEDIQRKLSEIVQIKKISINLDKPAGTRKVYALIEYENNAEAEAAWGALMSGVLLSEAAEWSFEKCLKTQKALEGEEPAPK